MCDLSSVFPAPASQGSAARPGCFLLFLLLLIECICVLGPLQAPVLLAAVESEKCGGEGRGGKHFMYVGNLQYLGTIHMSVTSLIDIRLISRRL